MIDFLVLEVEEIISSHVKTPNSANYCLNICNSLFISNLKRKDVGVIICMSSGYMAGMLYVWVDFCSVLFFRIPFILLMFKPCKVCAQYFEYELFINIFVNIMSEYFMVFLQTIFYLFVTNCSYLFIVWHR